MIANWKMNPGTRVLARKLSREILKKASRLKKTTVVIAPPFPFLGDLPISKKLEIGTQDVFWAKEGAFTGQVSAQVIKDFGAKYVIIGHSERRALGETDDMVSKKIITSIKMGLTPVVCVGETSRDHQGMYLSFLENQIKESLKGLSRGELSRIIIAYEPVWAIGKSANEAMNPEKLHEMTIFIKKILSRLFGRENALKTVLIYGGSVDATNAISLMKDGTVKGFLVGRASLEPNNFSSILEAVEKYKE